jgi:1,4-dihydroxy-2-naphthoate octaprenyltransferase
MLEEAQAVKHNTGRRAADIVRALRLSFLSASLLPFVLGSLFHKNPFHPFIFILGLTSALSTHLGANLINDYADSKSGVDWQDKRAYNFFGGSKLIQEKVFSEGFYLKLAILCFLFSIVCVVLLTLILRDLRVSGFYLLIALLGIAYSHKPLELSYRYLGEPVIFLLFGPALVMGGFFLQTGLFPDMKSFILSLPMGLLVMNILFANEIPDYPQDKKCGKANWVSLLGPRRSYLLYLLINACALLSIALNIKLGFLSKRSLISLLFILPALRAAFILKGCQEKSGMIESSKLAIAAHIFVSAVLIIDLILL